VSVQTQLPLAFGVLGDPIGHSRSPRMHAAAFAELGLPHRYMAFAVPAERLGAAIHGAAALGFGGLNLTVPHKMAAAAWVDRLGPEASRTRSVNTIVFDEGALVGHSTDGAGFLAGLGELGLAPDRAVVLGGGGAAHAIVDALAHRDPPCQVVWTSRAPGRLPAIPGVTAAQYGDLAVACEGATLLVNATTVGMQGGPRDFPSPIPLQRLASQAAVVDVVYPRPRGGLLDRAESRGLAVQDGLPMLLWQGVRALELWLRRPMPAPVIEAMRGAAGQAP
jgi:shikimate dehydrogenase